jgi:hypothetical protein
MFNRDLEHGKPTLKVCVKLKKKLGGLPTHVLMVNTLPIYPRISNVSCQTT